MEEIPNGRYTKEFRNEAARLVIENGLSTGEAATCFSLSKSTLEAWVRESGKGQ